MQGSVSSDDNADDDDDDAMDNGHVPEHDQDSEGKTGYPAMPTHMI